jgi:hypothetical protein
MGRAIGAEMLKLNKDSRLISGRRCSSALYALLVFDLDNKKRS